MESGPCLFTTEGEQSWHSVQDVMESLGSMTLFPEGCLNLEEENTKSSRPFRVNSVTPRDGNFGNPY